MKAIGFVFVILKDVSSLIREASLVLQDHTLAKFKICLMNTVLCRPGFKDLYTDMAPLCHVTDTDCSRLVDSSLLTPIDHLYSMQDSYFAS